MNPKNPSGPPTETVCEILVFPPAGSTLQWKRNTVPGMTRVSRTKDRPG